MTETQKSLISGAIGLFLGALIIYFGMQSLTQKIFTAASELGALQESIRISKNLVSDLQKKSNNTSEILHDLEVRSIGLNSKLELIENTDAHNIAAQIEVINSFSGEQEILVNLQSRVAQLQTKVNGSKVYLCPTVMPEECENASKCQSFCTGQLQINSSNCESRKWGGKAKLYECHFVGFLNTP